LEGNNLDETNERILEAIMNRASDAFITPHPLVKDLGMNEDELGDRLLELRDSGHIVAILASYAPGMSLSNGIHNVRLTHVGRQYLRNKDKR
jgi:DNA-binding Lrp family transcriptional regulator